jgi:hypothetical protein
VAIIGNIYVSISKKNTYNLLSDDEILVEIANCEVDHLFHAVHQFFRLCSEIKKKGGCVLPMAYVLQG